MAVGRPCGVVPAAVGVEHLVEALEEQSLVVVLESEGNLGPEGGVDHIVFRIIVSIGLQPVVAVEFAIAVITVGTGVVVHVDDAVEALVDNVIDNLFHSGHPLAIYLIVGVHVVVPGDGYADGAEACLLHHVDKFAGGLGLSPAGL